MREALEQTAWSIRTLIQQQYDTRKNSTLIRKALIFVILPILASYIIAHSNNHNSNNSSDVKISIAAYIWFMTIGGLSSFLLNIWQALLRIVGITLGIGLGLGLAGHVYDVLSDAQLDTSAAGAAGNRDGTVGEDNYNRRTTKTNNTLTSNSKPNLKEHNTTLLMEDANSYHSLMRSAGYTVDNGMMRAQMVRGEQAVDVRSANDAKRSLLLQKKMEQDGMLKPTVDDAIEPPPQQQQSRVSSYKFDKGTNASTQMRRMWPNLSPLINDSLAKLTEFVLRDYVSSWYSKVDEHVVYTDPSIGVVDGTATAVTAALGAVGVEEKELGMSSVSGERSTRPSTAPLSGSESLTKRRQMSVSSTSEVGTVGSITTAATTTNSSKGGGLARSGSELPTTTTTSTIRPRTSNSMELQSSLTSLSSSTAAAAAADPRIFQSPYAVHSPSNSHNTNQQQQPQQQRTMVLTTTGTQSSPFIDSLYTAFAYLLGMMATRSSENVNILELLLLHFPHILAQNLRVYREMKQVALEKKRRRIVVEREKWRRGQMEAMREVKGSGGGGGLGGSVSSGMASLSGNNNNNSINNMPTNTEKELESNDVSEIAIIREYLLAGRLHAALTFGMDVPSLLFADPLGKDCPPGPSHQGNDDWNRQKGHTDEDAILENRLLSPESSLIAECELDYNRVLASKVAKLVVSKNEIESSV
eukprot:scaffold10709_cov78-Skeletonema_dohrnii-CCMP3373.AAC.4